MASLLLAKADPSIRAPSGASPLDVAPDRRLLALLAAMAPPRAQLVADFTQFDEAVLLLPDSLQEEILLATESETRRMQI
mmetsp:Transcript_63967/g.198099  ORF Transcript_63967/g.198099 Transcript_63967/m.198099 type:complete len:80 (-) Transcript_63967:58-297(-)